MTILSFVLIFLGMGIRIFCRFNLNARQYWRIILPDGICKAGIYKHIRHPMYLGSLIHYFGFLLLASNNVFLSFVIWALLLNFTLDRIDREEQFLIGNFGDEYINYMKSTKALIPYVW